MDHAQPRRLNFPRGALAALALGAIGFVAPIIAGFAFTVCRKWFYGFNAFDHAYDLKMLPEYVADPAIGVALVCAAAGWAAYAPVRAQRLARTLIIVAAVSVPGWLALIGAAEALNLRPSKAHYTGKYRLVQPLDGLLAIPPAATAVALSWVRSRDRHVP